MINLIYALAPLGEAELGLGHPTRAIAPLRQALHLAEEEAVAEELPRLRFALARSLWESGRDRKQARLLAAAAAAPLASAPVADKETVLAEKVPGPAVRRPARVPRHGRRRRRRQFSSRRRRGCPSAAPPRPAPSGAEVGGSRNARTSDRVIQGPIRTTRVRIRNPPAFGRRRIY